ncbi:MAG: metal-sensing transcriptional repressor [Bulleidia sp.]
MNEEMKCPCCERTTVRTEEEKKKLIHRLKRMEGQIRGIAGMIEKDAYCADILTQSAAVTAAMNAFNRELLGAHIRGCVVHDIQEGHDEVVDELLDIIHRLMR